MPHYSEDSGLITINALDARILAVLLMGQNNGYAIARQCEDDQGNSRTIAISNVYKALPRLEEMMLVATVRPKPSPEEVKNRYRITSLGKMLLMQEVDAQKRFVRLVEDRSSK